MVNLEDLSEEELDQLAKFYAHVAKLALEERDLTCTHSIDAAKENHDYKVKVQKENTTAQQTKIRTRRTSIQLIDDKKNPLEGDFFCHAVIANF
ncbi:Uncharacterised protein [Sphingobacterium multivorum]|uniref:Uncharacterized protein n=1 Tax=Sphingobacterium multivorum TaxID=28454 RepID=A0A2X2IX33_SPHMU|nr:Uncharacterised protein [Sphingobacterium multivorum]